MQVAQSACWDSQSSQGSLLGRVKRRLGIEGPTRSQHLCESPGGSGTA